MSQRILIFAFITLLLAGASLAGAHRSAAPAAAGPKEKPRSPSWQSKLKQELERIDAAFPGEVGVYVKDLATGKELSFRAEEPWYIASGTKVPVALEVMRRVEAGELSLDTEMTLLHSDFVDGAGQTNWQEPGSRLRVDWLLEQMLIYSDNTATDMLIRLVGLNRVNALVRELVAEGFWDITTLADVRRFAYSHFHERAAELTSEHLLALRRQTDEQRRIETLARVLGLSTGDFAVSSLADAFHAYYATNLNGATLQVFGALLQRVVEEQSLAEPASTEHLLGVMRRVRTGDNRIKAGLPEGTVWAHKTGTQFERACDLGVAQRADAAGSGVIIAACTRGERSTARSEEALRGVGEAVAAAGLLSADPDTRN